MEIRAFAGRSRTNGLYRIATKGIYTKKLTIGNTAVTESQLQALLKLI